MDEPVECAAEELPLLLEDTSLEPEEDAAEEEEEEEPELPSPGCESAFLACSASGI